MSLDKHGEYRVTVVHSRMTKQDNGAHVRVYDEPREETVELLMDSATIIQRLGRKACLNKSGVAKYLHGCIVLRKVR